MVISVVNEERIFCSKGKLIFGSCLAERSCWSLYGRKLVYGFWGSFDMV